MDKIQCRLRQQVVAYADYSIAFKKLVTYEEIAGKVGLDANSIHLAKALKFLLKMDLVMGRPLRSSVRAAGPRSYY